ncbi:hypothetical protein PR048_008613 [Dryococelus australis]|uniref:Uncharacterized protein n=1 Tax=Dryococelus australis TaxID=614101 RepID=A0ABQ9HYF9_9NEOP|nr:hypothetical protein PR048_008613 [Dryococelus australis]
MFVYNAPTHENSECFKNVSRVILNCDNCFRQIAQMDNLNLYAPRHLVMQGEGQPEAAVFLTSAVRRRGRIPEWVTGCFSDSSSQAYPVQYVNRNILSSGERNFDSMLMRQMLETVVVLSVEHDVLLRVLADDRADDIMTLSVVLRKNVSHRYSLMPHKQIQWVEQEMLSVELTVVLFVVLSQDALLGSLLSEVLSKVLCEVLSRDVVLGSLLSEVLSEALSDVPIEVLCQVLSNDVVLYVKASWPEPGSEAVREQTAGESFGCARWSEAVCEANCGRLAISFPHQQPSPQSSTAHAQYGCHFPSTAPPPSTSQCVALADNASPLHSALCDSPSLSFVDNEEKEEEDEEGKMRKSGVVDTLIKNLLFELHILGYRFCGPGTKLAKRLSRNKMSINALDKACKQHCRTHTYVAECERW